jgi:hypothetical protein
MLIGKPHKQGTAQDLDVSDKSQDIVDLTQAQSASLVPAMDNMPYNNPDGASTRVEGIPTFLQGAPNGNPQAGRNTSRKGVIHKTGQSTVPKSNPFPAPGAPQTRTKTLTATK